MPTEETSQPGEDAMRWTPNGGPAAPAGDLTEMFGPVIHQVTRADLIAAGDLVPVSDAVAEELRLAYPVALTRAVWEDCVAWTPEDARRSPWPQDEAGRLWDVLWLAVGSRRSMTDGRRVPFQVMRRPRPGHGRRRMVTLVAVCHPGDDGQHVITIMMPNED